MTNQRWASAQGRAQGYSHQRTGKPCQDQTALIRGPGWVAAALADGAGSAPESETGAWVAAQSAAHAAATKLAASQTPDAADLKNIIKESFQLAQAELARLAAKRGRKTRDYACTLLLGLAAGRRAAAGQIGDGHAVAQENNGAFESITQPHRGEYANETLFLTNTGALDQLRLAEAEGDTRSLVLTSDGLQRLVMDVSSGRPHQIFFETATGWLAAQREAEAADTELQRTLLAIAKGGRTDDDLSLVIAVRQQEKKP